MSYRSENMLFSAAYLLFGALGISTKPVSMARNAAYLARGLAESFGKSKKDKTFKGTHKRTH